MIVSDAAEMASASLKTRTSCRASVAGLILLPWPEVSEGGQQWEARSEKLYEFVAQFIGPVADAAAGQANLNSAEITAALVEVMYTVTAMVDLVDGEAVKCKTIAVLALRDFFPLALQCIQGTDLQPEAVDALMGLFLALLRHMAPQIGTEFTEQALRGLVTAFVGERLPALLADRAGSATRTAAKKTLQLLAQVVKEPRASFKVFLPDIVQLCLTTLLPALAHMSALEIEGSLFEVRTTTPSFVHEHNKLHTTRAHNTHVHVR